MRPSANLNWSPPWHAVWLEQQTSFWTCERIRRHDIVPSCTTTMITSGETVRMPSAFTSKTTKKLFVPYGSIQGFITVKVDRVNTGNIMHKRNKKELRINRTNLILQLLNNFHMEIQVNHINTRLGAIMNALEIRKSSNDSTNINKRQIANFDFLDERHTLFFF